MKIRIEIVDDLSGDEVVVRCRRLSKEIQKIERAVSDITSGTPTLSCFKDNEEYFLDPSEILFFETDADTVYAHTSDIAYRVKLRLYELEEILPQDFIRISKSTIVSVNHILSIDRTVTAASLVSFHKSHKQVYVSRFYYKNLRQSLEVLRLKK